MTMPRLAPDRRLVEWGLLGLVLIVLAVAFMQQVRAVGSLGEIASVKTTLAALRTALALRHVGAAVGDSVDDVHLIQHGPFGLLQQRPPNFLGVVRGGRLAPLAEGTWAYDPDCGCVGYTPLQGQWPVASESVDPLWFRFVVDGATPRLLPMGPNLMRGEPIL